jgi:hypothetical protein
MPSIRKHGFYVRQDLQPEPGSPVAEPEIERVWTNRITLALRVFGRRAAREMWDASPLPSPSEMARRFTATPEEGMSCLRKLLSYRPNGEDAIGELILAAKVSEAVSKKFGHLGLRIDLDTCPDCLVVADVHPVIFAAMEGSQWETGWRLSLLAIPGAMPVPVVRFGRARIPCVAVPMRVLQN